MLRMARNVVWLMMGTCFPKEFHKCMAAIPEKHRTFLEPVHLIFAEILPVSSQYLR